MKFKIHSISKKGKFHEKNEDYHLVGDNYVIIADGIGGEAYGDIASKLAVETIDREMVDDSSDLKSDSDILKAIKNAMECADTTISEYIKGHPDSVGMGTTVLMTYWKGDKGITVWCGDSHGYSFHNGKLESITKDHSYIQELVESGEITVEESYTHPDNNLITKYVGGGDEVCSPDFRIHSISPDELFILCSDGMSGYCKTADIEKTISSNRDITKHPKELLDLAIANGSDDDITIAVLAPVSYKAGGRRHSFLSYLRNLFCY